MRRGIYIACACLAVLIGAFVAYELGFHDAPPAEAGPVAPAPDAAAGLPVSPPPQPFLIGDVAGTVEVRRGDAWAPVASGDRLGPDDAIRTGSDGRAVIRTDGGDELFLRERVQLELGELTLTRGKVRAQTAAGTERLEITAGDAKASAGHGGRFTIYADPAGAVTVASETGDTRVIARGTEVAVGAGKQTFVPPGGTPRDPVPVPDEVFLSVAWPGGEVHAPRAQVKGKAAPGTSVLVNGEPTAVKDDGTFETQVALKEGPNKVSV